MAPAYRAGAGSPIAARLTKHEICYTIYGMVTLFPEDWEERQEDFWLWVIAVLIPVIALLITDMMVSGR